MNIIFKLFEFNLSKSSKIDCQKISPFLLTIYFDFIFIYIWYLLLFSCKLHDVKKV